MSYPRCAVIRGVEMVDQLPNLGREKEMLAAMGLSSMDDLFEDIPENVRMNSPLPLRPPQSEEEILADARLLLGSNVALGDRINFLGAGLYSLLMVLIVIQMVVYGY